MLFVNGARAPVGSTLERMIRRLIALAATVIPTLAGCFPDPCGNEIKQAAAGPSGKLSAVVFYRDCGATTGFSTQVSIIPASRSLPNEPGNAFVTGGKVDLYVQWQNDSTLRIKGKGESVFKQETRVGTVTVKYEPNAP